MSDRLAFWPEAFPLELLGGEAPETWQGDTEWSALEEESRRMAAPRRQGFSARRRMPGRPGGRVRPKPRPWPRRRPWPGYGSSASGPIVVGHEPADGSGSEQVRWVQDCLNRAMSANLPVDGLMSPATRSLIRSFQQRQGMRPTGIMGPDTEDALKRACAGGADAPDDSGREPAGGEDNGGTTKELTMHDINCRCRRCSGGRVASFAPEPFRYEAGPSFAGEAESLMSEADETALAFELLSVSSEAELDQFLGKLVSSAWKGIKKVGSVVGKIAKPLGGVLKAVAKKALPFVGGALGSFIPIPGVGTAIGSALGGAVAKALEAETESLEIENRELEMARRFVRIATTAAQQAASTAPGMDGQAAVNQAVVAAARQHLPQLQFALPGRGGLPGGTSQGKWVRSGQQIVVLGA